MNDEVIETPPRAFTLHEFIATYRIGRTRAYSEIRAGRLVCRRVGRRTMILRDDAERWLASLPVHRPSHGDAA